MGKLFMYSSILNLEMFSIVVRWLVLATVMKLKMDLDDSAGLFFLSYYLLAMTNNPNPRRLSIAS